MLSVAVCDDEILECCNLAAAIRKLLEGMRIPYTLARFYSGRELLEAKETFDIIFLDILMEGLDGMETARRWREQTGERLLVFVSSSRDYVFDAYDVEAFQYLVKPVDEGKLERVLARAVEKGQHSCGEYLTISKERQWRKVFLDRIWYFEIRGRQIDLHGADQILTYYGQMGELEAQLRGRDFFRCHKGYLVNLKHVETYNRQEVILDNGERIPIARRRYEPFCQEILAFMRKDGGIL